MKQVIHVGVFAKRVSLGERVIGHSDQFLRVQSGGAAMARQLRGFHEFREVVGSLGQKLEYVLRAYDGEQIRFGIAVDGGKEYMALRFDERRASLYPGRFTTFLEKTGTP